jgi:protoporphyrinogen oxidase
MPDSNPRVLIIGSGVCGLYAGITLVRAGATVTIVEKEPRIGGLAAGFKFGENYCDFGVHMLHAFNKEIFEDRASMMGSERIEVALDARIRWGGMICNYPLKFKDMLKAMPVLTLARCVTGLLIAELSGTKNRAKIDNAEDALIAFYGAPLYEYFFEEFTHKYWNIHPRDLSAEFIRRKMPRLSAVDIMRKLLLFKTQRHTNITESALGKETLHYSKTGSETLPRSLASTFQNLGGKILTDSQLSQLSLKPCQATYFHQKHEQHWQGDHIINTAPLHALFALLQKDAPPEVHFAVAQLKYKPTVVYAILVNKFQCMDGLYTYFRNRTFHRIGEPKNAGVIVQPSHQTILIVESTCEIDDYKWLGTDRFKDEIIADLADEELCYSHEIVSWNLMRNPNAYPIYTNGFDTHLEKFTAWIEQQSTLSSTGRQGAFCYPAMHSAMQLGKMTAQQVIENIVR